ncbi:hypothetical protein Tco_0281893 [Tanacetum coccineum]
MEIPDIMTNDAIKQTVGYKYYKIQKDQSNQEVNVSSKPKKVVVPKKPRTITIADNIVEQETLAFKLAKSVNIEEQRLQQQIDSNATRNSSSSDTDEDNDTDDAEDSNLDIFDNDSDKGDDDATGFRVFMYNESNEPPKFTPIGPTIAHLWSTSQISLMIHLVDRNNS